MRGVGGTQGKRKRHREQNRKRETQYEKGLEGKGLLTDINTPIGITNFEKGRNKIFLLVK